MKATGACATSLGGSLLSLQLTHGKEPLMPVVKKCNVVTCPDEAKYAAKLQCKESCKINPTTEIHSFCDMHMQSALRGRIPRAGCHHDTLVETYEPLGEAAQKRIGDTERGKVIERLSDAY